MSSFTTSSMTYHHQSPPNSLAHRHRTVTWTNTVPPPSHSIEQLQLGLEFTVIPDSELTRASESLECSNSPRQPAVHWASLIDPSLHSPALLRLLDTTTLVIIQPVVEYIMNTVVKTVEYAMASNNCYPLALAQTQTSVHFQGSTPHIKHVSQATSDFMVFAKNVVARSAANMPVLLGALVYIHRARPYLRIATKEWAFERVFLGAIMLASKYLNDSMITNGYWALYTGIFGRRDVGLIEREMLGVLGYELGILENDILDHLDDLSAAIYQHENFDIHPLCVDASSSVAEAMADGGHSIPLDLAATPFDCPVRHFEGTWWPEQKWY